MLLRKLAITTIAAIFFSASAFAQELKVTWKEGLRFSYTKDDIKYFELKFGGRVHYDVAFFYHGDAIGTVIEDSIGNFKNGTQFRRARFYMSGTIYERMEYKLQLDFAGGKVAFKDAFIALKDVKHEVAYWKVTVGQFKEPFRLEALTSSNYMTFMERANPIDFSPERNTGLMLSGEIIKSRIDKYGRFGWQAGIFRNADDFGNDKMAEERFNVTARVSGLPVDAVTKKGMNVLLHLGAAFSHRNKDNGEYEIASRPDAHLAEKYISTGKITDVSMANLVGGEVALVVDRFSVQGEVVHAYVEKSNSNFKHSFLSYYGQVSFFLTPDSRKYKSSYEGFDRVKPANNLGEKVDTASGKKHCVNRGAGAWEIAIRYSRSDLNDDNVRGGILGNLTAGLNWYLNPMARIMINYTYARLNSDKINGKSYAHVAQMRFQVDF